MPNETLKIDQQIVDTLVNGLIHNDTNNVLQQIDTMQSMIEVTRAKMQELTNTIEKLKTDLR